MTVNYTGRVTPRVSRESRAGGRCKKFLVKFTVEEVLQENLKGQRWFRTYSRR